MENMGVLKQLSHWDEEVKLELRILAEQKIENITLEEGVSEGPLYNLRGDYPQPLAFTWIVSFPGGRLVELKLKENLSAAPWWWERLQLKSG